MGTIVEELERIGNHLAEGVVPGVVRIGRGTGRGAGFVVAGDAVLTNAHNVRGSEVTVTFADGRQEVGTVAGLDIDGDLAVVRVPTGEAPALIWADEVPGLGAPVFSVTVPAGVGARVTFGTVSATGVAFRGPRDRLIASGVEHTAPLARGSSGSPLVGADGRVLGVSTHRLGEGFYLALRADAELRARVDALVRGESTQARYLGIAIVPSHAARRLRASVGLPERDGLLVRAVDGSGPAGRAGVRGGDLIVEAAGRPVTTPDDLFEVLGSADGDHLDLRIARGNDELEVRVSFEEAAGAGTEEGSA